MSSQATCARRAGLRVWTGGTCFQSHPSSRKGTPVSGASVCGLVEARRRGASGQARDFGHCQNMASTNGARLVSSRQERAHVDLERAQIMKERRSRLTLTDDRDTLRCDRRRLDFGRPTTLHSSVTPRLAAVSRSDRVSTTR